MTFTIVVYNPTDPACEYDFTCYNMQLMDTLDPVFRIDSASSTMGSVTITDQTVIVDSDITLAGQESFTTTIHCTIVGGAGRAVINDAEAEYTDADGRPQVPFETEIPVLVTIEAAPVVPETSTLILLGGAATGLAGFVGLQIKARRRRNRR